MCLRDRIENMMNMWFLTEPAYYIVLASVPIEISNKTNNICCGKGKIYANDEFFDTVTDKEMEEYFKLECIRILLKHPYQRVLPDKRLAYLASNMLIRENIDFKHIKITSYADVFGRFHIEDKCYEDIYNDLRELFKTKQKNQKHNDETNNSDSNNTSVGGGDNMDGKSEEKDNGKGDGENEGNGEGQGNSKNKSRGRGGKNILEQLTGREPNDSLVKSDDDCMNNTSEWDNDEVQKNLVDNIIGKLSSSREWGSIPNALSSLIQSAESPRFDYRSIIRMFRKDVMTSTNVLTRMKPNRRHGFLEMGKKRAYTANILIVCDTSGSMSDEEIGRYLGFVGGFFNYGFNEVDVIQFDVKVYDETLQTFTCKPKFIKSVSRGGTDVSDIIDYVNKRAKKKYGGVVICTDGGFHYNASKWNNECGNMRYLFCINSKSEYENHKDKMVGKIKSTYIDFNVDN